MLACIWTFTDQFLSKVACKICLKSCSFTEMFNCKTYKLLFISHAICPFKKWCWQPSEIGISQLATSKNKEGLQLAAATWPPGMQGLGQGEQGVTEVMLRNQVASFEGRETSLSCVLHVWYSRERTLLMWHCKHTSNFGLCSDMMLTQPNYIWCLFEWPWPSLKVTVLQERLEIVHSFYCKVAQTFGMIM